MGYIKGKSFSQPQLVKLILSAKTVSLITSSNAKLCTLLFLMETGSSIRVTLRVSWKYVMVKIVKDIKLAIANLSAHWHQLMPE